jgi:hypothetical protein
MTDGGAQTIVPDRRRLVMIVLLGLFALSALAWQAQDRLLTGRNDFFAIYPGIRLALDPNLYDKPTQDQVQAESAQGYSDGMAFLRLPFYGVMLWPLGTLPYLQAYGIFLALNCLALIGFVAIWRPPLPAKTLEAACLFLPAMVAFLNGQDIPILLLLIAMAVRLEAGRKSVAAGVLLALGAIKIHLFLLIPLLILAGGFWAVGVGYALGGLGLLAASFAAQGRNWPLNYYHLFSQAVVNPNVEFMPNLNNLCHQLPFSGFLQAILTVAVIVSAWAAVRRSSFLRGLGIVLCGGLLIGHHSYLADCSLLLPVALSARSLTDWPLLRTASDLFLKPFFYVFLFLPVPVFPLLLVGYFSLLACAPWREGKETPRQSHATA